MINLYVPNINIKQNTENKQSLAFLGATEVFSKRFISTQKEIIDEFIKDPQSNWIAGNLPESWLAKLNGKTNDERQEITQKIFMLFRSAIKHLKPYSASPLSKEYNRAKVNLENKRIKEASKFLTKGLRHFGILSETNSVYLKKLNVTGQYIKRGYSLKEKGKNPTLEKLFIKKFKKINPISLEGDLNGQYSEIAHGLYINNKVPDKYITKFYWGDTQTGYMASKYEITPRHKSPIVKFKSSYDTVDEFGEDFYNKTGIQLTEILDKGIIPGVIRQNKFHPYSKEALILRFLQSLLDEYDLHHFDLHNLNAIIGSTETGGPIVKIIDIGGIASKT